MRLVAAYFLTLVVFLGIDFVWLTKLARHMYVENIGEMLLERPRLAAAALFYALYVVGIIVFAVSPALRTGSVGTALLFGALFGFLAYATYDMTNFATLKNWPLIVTVVDMAWGAVLTGVSAAAGYLITRALIP